MEVGSYKLHFESKIQFNSWLLLIWEVKERKFKDNPSYLNNQRDSNAIADKGRQFSVGVEEGIQFEAWKIWNIWVHTSLLG